LVPSTKQSAERCYHGPITKAGNGRARWMLIQAAQHVRLHPGPLGVFFRRLAKKKNYNVAVVAAARKLVVIAWHMLTRNEPYRYAQPRATEGKLSRLRVKATGAKRKTGPAKGSAKAAATPVPSRRVKSLAGVYAAEGLPALGPAPAGEARTLEQTRTADYAAGLGQDQRTPRGRRRTEAGSADAPPIAEVPGGAAVRGAAVPFNDAFGDWATGARLKDRAFPLR
jgi:hypothetical protein